MTKRPWYAQCEEATTLRGTDPKEQMYPQCLACSGYKKLDGDVGADYGVCLMPPSAHFGIVVMEHFGCKSHQWVKE